MDCAPEWAPGRESSLRSAGWASKGSGEALHLAVGRHVRARKLPLELVWIKNVTQTTLFNFRLLFSLMRNAG